MKMSRTDLKALIKECLVEILADGLGESLNEAVAPQQRTPRRGKTRTARRAHQPNKQQYGGLPTAALQAAVMESAGGNSVMADILADTAVTTLPQMLSNTGAPPPLPGSAEDVMANAEPEEVFGENVDRWANLAFGGETKSSGLFTPPPPPSTVRKLSAAELDAPVGGSKKTA